MLRIRHIITSQRRWKSQRWSSQQRKNTNTDRALESFDDFYGSVFGGRWKNIRAALLTQHKYVALVNNFGDTDKICSGMEMNGALNMKSLINLAKERIGHYKTQPQIGAPHKRVDETLDELMRKQEAREKHSIYPEGTVDAPTSIPEQLHYGKGENIGDSNSSETANDLKIFGLSLEETIEKGTQIDHSRLINPQHGTGGLYEFMPASRIKGMEDWVPESDHYKYYQTKADFPLKFELETEFTYPENLNLYAYEIGNCSEFKTPKKCLTGVLSHYLMDGASVLPPLILDIRQGEHVLDACAAPGGKSLLMLQTLHPNILVCNDIQESRLNRIRKVMEEYIFDYKENWSNKRVALNQCDARNLDGFNSYDKILVDVPCTTDRHSLMENDNNIFKSTRIKERLRIPELQADILANCLRLLKPGGSLVYSTCALSPVQNDGVVHMALQKVFNEHNISVTVKDLSYLIKLFEDIFRFEFSKNMKYGQLVLPFLPANYGPMYFSKLTKNT